MSEANLLFCSCGAERCKLDAGLYSVDGAEFPARAFGNHGPLWDFQPRVCRYCGAVYAVPPELELPDAPRRRIGRRRDVLLALAAEALARFKAAKKRRGL